MNKYKDNNLQHIRNELKKDSRPVGVDVYVLVYNHGRFLKQALEGILNQKTTFPVRILIHDDASTDNSLQIIKEYKERYLDRIIVVTEEKNLYRKGFELIWRKMLPLFTSKYFAICEGDDYWTDDYKLQKQIDYLECNADCVAVYHNIMPVDVNSVYNEELRGGYLSQKERDYSSEEIVNFELRTQTCSCVMHNFHPFLEQDDIEKYSNTQTCGDIKYFILCGVLGRIHILPDVMAAHRVVKEAGDSWSARQHRLSEVDRWVDSMNRYLEQCKYFEFYSGKKRYHYNDVILDEILFALRRKSGKRDLLKVPFMLKVPVYAYFVFAVFAVIKILQKMVKIMRISSKC